MAREEQPLRETIRQYPNKERLSNEAASTFNQTFKEQSKTISAKKAFTAAKQAVEAIPKDRRYKAEDEDEDEDEDEAEGDAEN